LQRSNNDARVGRLERKTGVIHGFAPKYDGKIVKYRTEM